MTPLRCRLLSAMFALSSLSWVGAAVQQAPSQTTTPATSQQNDTSAQEKVTTEYKPPQQQYEKAVAYSAEHYRHVFLDTFYGWLVLLVVLRWRIGAKYREWAERASSRRFVQVIIYGPLLLLSVALLGLPADLWDESLQRRYGLSVQSWTAWGKDWISGQIVLLIVATILVWILYGVVRRSTRRWWLYFWMASIPVLLTVFFLQPLVVDPLFYKFTPLQTTHPELVSAMEQVVQHGGMNIPPERMFEMNASTKTTATNAYVTGFGASKRAVVWDTTIKKATVPETLFVFGHEMGHYVLLHTERNLDRSRNSSGAALRRILGLELGNCTMGAGLGYSRS